MKIDTTRFGQIEINSDDIINIPKGPVGFPDHTKFIFVDKENELPFRTLQSLDSPTYAFMVINPQIVRPDYRVDITPDDLKLIEADTIETVVSRMSNVGRHEVPHGAHAHRFTSAQLGECLAWAHENSVWFLPVKICPGVHEGTHLTVAAC